MRLLYTLRPKSTLQWVVFCAAVFNFLLVVGPRLSAGAMAILVFVASLIIVAAFTVPESTIDGWEELPRLARRIILAVAAYCLVVTVGFFGELYHLSSLLSLWFFASDVPYTSTHTAAILAGISAGMTQSGRFFPEPASAPPGDVLVRGHKLITEDQAWAIALGPSTLAPTDIQDAKAFALKLKRTEDPVSQRISQRLSRATTRALAKWSAAEPIPNQLHEALVGELNAVISGPSIWDLTLFSGVQLRPEVKAFLARNPRSSQVPRLNRLLLEDAYPADLIKKPRTISWGGLELPERCAYEHFCIVGDPGSGKTKSLQLLLKSVLPTITAASNRRAILYDAKRDTLSTLAQMKIAAPVYILNPFDRRSVAWNMAEDITEAATAIEIATVLIPERNQRENFFPQAARALLSGVMESFLRKAPGKWTLRDVVLALRYPSRTRVVLRETVDTRYLLYKYAGDNVSNKDIASTLENTMRRLSFIAAAWASPAQEKPEGDELNYVREPISLTKWLDSESILVLGSTPNMESTIVQVNTAILHRLSQLIRNQGEAEREKGNKPLRQTWVILDELRQAGRLDGLHDLIVEARSKGACIVIGFQDMPGLRSVYDQNLAPEIAGVCANKAFLRISEPETQAYAASVFGSQDVDIPHTSTSFSTGTSSGWSSGSGQSSTSGGTNTGTSTSFSMNRTSRPLILPSQFTSDLPRPTPELGISGFYQTALVHAPYRANIAGSFIAEQLPLPQSTTSDFLVRPNDALNLKEWDMADLERLNLKEHPELLQPDEMNSSDGIPDWNVAPTRDSLN